jgi:hypothetical protein
MIKPSSAMARTTFQRAMMLLVTLLLGVFYINAVAGQDAVDGSQFSFSPNLD